MQIYMLKPELLRRDVSVGIRNTGTTFSNYNTLSPKLHNAQSHLKHHDVMNKMATREEQDRRHKELSRGHVVFICHEFATDTSAHGMSHIIRAKGKRRRFFWLFVTIALIAVWILHSQDTIRKYLKNEVNVQIEIKTTRKLPFPAVTICNKNPYKWNDTMHFMEAMNKSASEAVNLHENDTHYAPTWFLPWIQTLVDSDGDSGFEATVSSPKFGEQVLQLLSELLEVYGDQYGYYFQTVTFDPNEFVLSCLYEREDCYKRHDITTHVIFNWLYGNCVVYQLNHNSSRTGPRFGLELVVNIKQEEYMDLVTHAGALVLVHPQHEMPFPDDEGISIPPGQAAFIGVKVRQTERLGGKFGDCVDAKKQENITNYFREEYNWTSYSLKTCQRSCIQRNLREMCKCYDVRFPPYDYSNYTSCLSSYYSTYDFNQGWPDSFGCQDEVTEKFNNQQLGCDKICHVPCKQTSYQSSVSYSAWPSEVSMDATLDSLKGSSTAADEIIEHGFELFRKNFLHVTVYFEDLNYELISEKEAVELPQMLSDLGGNTGMYVGASLFTIIEFIELFGDLWLWICCKSRRRKYTKGTMPGDEDFIPDNRRPDINHVSDVPRPKYQPDTGFDNNGFFYNGHMEMAPFDRNNPRR